MKKCKNKYNADYFIKKFKGIPTSKWITHTFTDGNGYCALGHCGHTTTHATEQSQNLVSLFKNFFDRNVVAVNDNWYLRCRQKTPRARILAALKDIKNKGG